MAWTAVSGASSSVRVATVTECLVSVSARPACSVPLVTSPAPNTPGDLTVSTSAAVVRLTPRDATLR